MGIVKCNSFYKFYIMLSMIQGANVIKIDLFILSKNKAVHLF